MSASKLVRPAADYKDSFLDALREYHEHGQLTHLKIEALRENFDEYLAETNADRGHPHRPYEDWVEPVPETILWLVKDGLYIGSLSIRHRLNWHLEKWGGHLSFTIRPSMRGRGFGKKILLKAIPFANYLGIEKALLTVDPYNKAAIRIVESVGAVFEEELAATDEFPARRRYWLDCS